MGPGGSVTIPGNSQLGLLVLPIPQNVARGPRGLVFSPDGMEVVLGALFYTRQYGGGPWGLVLHQAVWRWSLGPSFTPGKWDECGPR